MPQINTVLLDREIAHQIMVENYKSNLTEQINTFDPDFDDFDFNNRPALRSRLRRRFVRIRGIITSGRENFIRDELRFQSNTISSNWYTPKRTTLAQINRKIVGPNLLDQRTLPRSLDAIERQEFLRVRNSIRRGIAEGKSRSSLRRIALRSSAVTKNQSTALLNTELTRASSIVKTEVANENPDLIKSYLFSAILDSKTSDICRSNHNREIPIDNERYIPPLHFNCRSTVSYVTYSRSELEARGLSPPSDLQTGLPDIETLDEWLLRQPFSVQVLLFGSERAVSLWQRGLPAQSLLTRQGNVRSLAAIRRQDSALSRLLPFYHKVDPPEQSAIPISRPVHLINSRVRQEELRNFYRSNSTLELTDYRGVTLQGKRSSLLAREDPVFDPVTGNSRSNRLYDPDFQLLQQRIEFVRNSKDLSLQQRDFIINFVNSIEDVGVNRQAAIAENLRIIFGRYNRDRTPWDNLDAVLNSELRFSVVNVSKLLDRRSRSRDQLWLKWGRPDQDAEIFVGNTNYKLADLHRLQRRHELEAQQWSRTIARREAQKILLRGRAPWFTYFIKPISRPALARYRDALQETIENIRNIPQNIADLPARLRRAPREAVRRFLDFERVLRDNRLTRTLEYSLLSRRTDPDLQRAMQQAVRSVASGLQTDYDGLAINIGRDFYLSYFRNITDEPATLQTYHRAGSRLLDDMVRRRLIRVNSRGTVRRAVTDLDTGRPSGAWKDTVSREVEIISPSFRRYAELNRILYVTRRLGIIDRDSRLHARRGSKDYFDSRGNRTDVRATTRDAYERIPEEQIDSDFVNMFNQANSVQYKTDPEYTNFMYRVFTFRDPRGRTQYYDSLNGFREEIVRRGDLGYGLMETARYHATRNRPFTLYSRVDSRGRLYYNGYLTPTGGEVVRPFLDSARSKVLTERTYFAIQNSIANILGDANQKLSIPDRLDVFNRNKAQLVSLGRIMSSTTQPDRRIREFLEHPLIREIDPEEVSKLARLALEVYRVETHRGRLPYRTNLQVEIDASASALQMIAMTTRNRELANLGNLFAKSRKERIYDVISQATVNDPRFQKLTSDLGVELSWPDLEKAGKYSVMLMSYGAGRTTVRGRIVEELAKVLNKRDINVITRPEQLRLLREINSEIKRAEIFDTPEAVTRLTAFRNELDEFLQSAGPIQQGRELLTEAENLPEIHKFLTAYVGNRNPTLTAQQIRPLADLMSEKLAENTSIPELYVTFYKRVAQRYAEETGSSSIPWYTFDDKILIQDYRPKVETEVRFFDPVSKRYIRNIYSRTTDDGTLTSKAVIGDVRLGFPVNGNHALDATAVRQFHLWGRRNNVDTATIHDAIYVHASDVDQSINALNQIYSNATDSDQFRKNLRNLRRSGLSESSYREFLDEAQQLGLFSDQFVGSDIIRQPDLGEYYYSWDY